MESSKTINLTGTEVFTEFKGTNAWLRNDGASTIYAAKNSGINERADGVTSIPSGQSAPVYGAEGKVYLLGTGSVQLIGSDYSSNPFKTSAQSGGSSADEVEGAAISEHINNTNIHVTADEKTAWNSKADMDHIPTSLPANGGNADTLDGKHAAEFTQSYFVPPEPDVNLQLENGYYMMADNSVNAPETGYGFLFVAKAGNVDISINWIAQFWFSINTGAIYKRLIINGTFGNWEICSNSASAI